MIDQYLNISRPFHRNWRLTRSITITRRSDWRSDRPRSSYWDWRRGSIIPRRSSLTCPKKKNCKTCNVHLLSYRNFISATYYQNRGFHHQATETPCAHQVMLLLTLGKVKVDSVCYNGQVYFPIQTAHHRVRICLQLFKNWMISLTWIVANWHL